MNKLLAYIYNSIDSRERGEMINFPDPEVPADLGSALTQDQIDKLKQLLAELERFDLL